MGRRRTFHGNGVTLMKSAVKKIVRSFVVLFLFGFFGCGALIINYIIFPCAAVFVKKSGRKAFYCNVVHKTWGFFNALMEKSGAIKIETENPESLKNIRGKIIVANHPSFIDIVLLIGIIPDTICIAKKELKKNIFMGNIVKSLFLINDENQESMLKESAHLLSKGYNLIIFPTGTRTVDGKTLKLHKGAAMLAIHTKTDIIPVCINCSRKFLAKNQKIYDAGEETVVYKISVNGEIKIEDFSKRDLTEIQLRNRVNSAIKNKISTQLKN